jgi:putative redox protein
MRGENMLTARANWTGGLHFVCKADSGHTTEIDVPLRVGGESSAPSPVETTLMALAACGGVDVVSILTKMKCPPTSLEVRADAERGEKHPRVFTHIRVLYVVTGDVPEKNLQRAIQLSAKTYCSIGAMLGAIANIDYDYELRPA